MTAGCTYDFTTSNGAKIVAEGSEEIESVTKRIAKEETEVVEFNTGVIYVDWEDVRGENALNINAIKSSIATSLKKDSVLCLMNGYNQWKNNKGSQEEFSSLYNDSTLFVRVVNG